MLAIDMRLIKKRPKSQIQVIAYTDMANSKYPIQAGISTFALSNRPRATRSIVAKVRTGCITCKRRHVKCDESKPSCSRCLKWRGYCEGYGAKTGPSKGKQKNSQADDEIKKENIKQEDNGSSSHGTQCHTQPQMQTQTPMKVQPQPPPQPQPQPQKTTDSQQSVPRWFPTLTWESQRLLHEAHGSTVPFSAQHATQRPLDVPASPVVPRGQESRGSHTPDMLRSPTSTTTSNSNSHSNSVSTSTSTHVPEFWRDTVPMLLRQIPSVYYAHLAIHALIDARQTKWAAEEGSSGTDSYNRALRYFGIALAEVQKQTISPRSLQSATLCCLFFIIFEMMNGDERAAQTHFSNGRKMLAELGRSDPSKTTQDTEAIIYRELRMALRFLAVQIQGSREASGTRSCAKSN